MLKINIFPDISISKTSYVIDYIVSRIKLSQYVDYTLSINILPEEITFEGDRIARS